MSSQDNNKCKYLEEFNHIECIGKGAFGVVFKAEHKFLGVVYAVKRIWIQQDEKYDLEQVYREAKALAKVDHPNIVKFNNAWLEEITSDWQEKLDLDLLAPFSSGVSLASGVSSINPSSSLGKNISEKLQDRTNQKIIKQCSESALCKDKNKYLYIQMEFCEGGNLKDWLFSDERTPSLCNSIFNQLLSAVVYLHQHNLIHRDLKPTNIFFSSKDRIKVGDFGLVTEDSKFCYESECCETLHVHTGYVGTKLYMSPEMAARKPYNAKVDVYSLGIIFYELLVSFQTEMERVISLTNIKSKIFPTKFIQDFSKEFEILQKMLLDDPLKRISAMDVMKIVDTSKTEDSAGELKSLSSLSTSVIYLDLIPTGFRTKYTFCLSVLICKNQICKYIDNCIYKSIDFNDHSLFWINNSDFPTNATLKNAGAVALVKLNFCHSIFHNPYKTNKNKIVLRNTRVKDKKYRFQDCFNQLKRIWYIKVLMDVKCTSKINAEWFIKLVFTNKTKMVKLLKALPEISEIENQNAKVISFTWNCELFFEVDSQRLIVRDVLQKMGQPIIELLL